MRSKRRLVATDERQTRKLPRFSMASPRIRPGSMDFHLSLPDQLGSLNDSFVPSEGKLAQARTVASIWISRRLHRLPSD